MNPRSFPVYINFELSECQVRDLQAALHYCLTTWPHKAGPDGHINLTVERNTHGESLLRLEGGATFIVGAHLDPSFLSQSAPLYAVSDDEVDQ